jgi:hypothetical protein
MRSVIYISQRPHLTEKSSYDAESPWNSSEQTGYMYITGNSPAARAYPKPDALTLRELRALSGLFEEVLLPFLFAGIA